MPASHFLPDFSGHVVDDGRLQLCDILGTGSYGVVYRALDLSLPSMEPLFFAVKCLGSGTKYDLREIELHTICSPHRSVLTVHRQFEYEGLLFLVLDLAVCDLWRLIDDGEFFENDALLKKAFLQILDGVRWCHDRGIHHRDLKPDNILCCPNAENLRIADFGMAVDNELPSSTAAGTTTYMSPESLSLGYGTSSYEPADGDVWACGIILINMATGGFPWRKAVRTDNSYLSFLWDEHYLRTKFPMLSAPLLDLLQRCFRTEPATRPQLIQLRFEIANMKRLYRNSSPSTAVPLTIGPSSSTPPSESLVFDPSDYPTVSSSSSTSVATSEMFPITGYAACDKFPHAVSPSPPPEHDQSTPPQDPVPKSVTANEEEIDPETAALPASGRAILARLRARPPPRFSWPSDDPVRDPLPPPAPKKASRNPLPRLSRWLRKTFRA